MEITGVAPPLPPGAADESPPPGVRVGAAPLQATAGAATDVGHSAPSVGTKVKGSKTVKIGKNR